MNRVRTLIFNTHTVDFKHIIKPSSNILWGTVMEIGINLDRAPTSRHHDDNDDDVAVAKFCTLTAYIPRTMHCMRHPPKVLRTWVVSLQFELELGP